MWSCGENWTRWWTTLLFLCSPVMTHQINQTTFSLSKSQFHPASINYWQIPIRFGFPSLVNSNIKKIKFTSSWISMICRLFLSCIGSQVNEKKIWNIAEMQPSFFIEYLHKQEDFTTEKDICQMLLLSFSSYI